MTTRHIITHAPKSGHRARNIALVFLAATTLSAVLAPRAEAGYYSAAQCLSSVTSYAHDQFFWTTPKPSPAYKARDEYCGQNEYAHLGYERSATGVVEANGASQGDVGGMIFQAPYGSKIASVTLGAKLVSGSGNQPRIYLEDANATNQSMIKSGDSGGWQAYTKGGYHDRFVAAMRCWQSSCPKVHSRVAVQDMRFTLYDWRAPWITGWGGSLVSGGWKRGTGYSLSASAFDYGAGVHRIYVYANGSTLASQSLGCPSQPSGYFPRFSGCYGGQTRGASWSGLSTQQGGLREGQNKITACAYDFAHSGNSNSGCSNATIYIDNVAPATPAGLSLAGTASWRPVRGFDLSWQNPAQSCTCSPLAATHYRLTGPDGYDTGDRRVSLRTKLEGFNVPDKPGDYTLSTWAEDGAGNHNAGSAATAQLRFDDTVPPASQAASSGWLERSDFPHVLEWSRPNLSVLGPSGLKGYAVVIDDEPDTDPCMADDDPACSDAEVNHAGGAEDSSELLESYRNGEGHFVHVVAVSGAGVKAPEVRHTAMPVDKRDPETRLVGVPSGWVNQDVRLIARATDSHSGMEPDPAYPEDPGPRTVIQVDGDPEQSAAGDAVGVRVEDEGAHEVRYWARDLAGNENDGRLEGEEENNWPGSARVKIDKTAPSAAFQNAESEDDPSLITASISDALSGVVSGEISIRPASGGKWEALRTSLEGGQLSARVPDEMNRGRYEMRARATDAASNVSFSGARADGSAMVVELPLKTVVELSGGLGPKEREKVKLGYGHPGEVTGVLRTETGAPLARKELNVVESFGAGTRTGHSARAVTTDERGRFSAPLSAGPSRRVSVRYPGSRREFGAELPGLRMRVRAAVLRFRAPRRIPEHRKLVFRGRVGAFGVSMGNLGKLVELQYLKDPGDWKTIRTGKARRRGRFRIGYRLRNNYTRPARVVFRVRVPKERNWPYVGSARSRSRSTVIMPR